MALRKAIAYSHKKEKPYTRRSRVKGQNYIKAIPPSKIVKFLMGDIKKFDNKGFPFNVVLKSVENAQVRDVALEAARQHIHRELELAFKGNYFLKVCCYPHHVLRENKMITGAGADRLQSGMSQAFGAAVGIAAQIKKGKIIFLVGVSTQKDTTIVRNILQKIRPKIACSGQILVEQINK